MSHTIRLKRVPDTFWQLTGITPEAFDRLLTELEPLHQRADAKRKTRRPRQRKPGAGSKFALPLADRLLMLLMYYRTYTTHALLGFLFGIDQNSVCRNIDPLQPLLAGIFRTPSAASNSSPTRSASFSSTPPSGPFPGPPGVEAVLLGEEEAPHLQAPHRGRAHAQGARSRGPMASGADRRRVPRVPRQDP